MLRRSFIPLAAVAAVGASSAAPAAASSAASASASSARPALCANKLCTRDRPAAPSCWRFKHRDRVARCFIVRAAEHYGQPSGQALAIARRESRLQWRVRNRRSGAAGLFQFMPATWRFTPYAKHSPLHPRWASLGAMWMWKRGYASHWAV